MPNLFRELGLDVVELIGPPGRSPTAQASVTSSQVLRQLTAGGFDLLHYSGHGAFDSADPSKRAGWVFADGLLTSQELEVVDQPPRLVVANACHSGRLSEAATGDPNTEVGLLPSLADEFFRRGVRDYVGTAWAIDDAGAIEFATVLYGQLLDPARARARRVRRSARRCSRLDVGWRNEAGTMWRGAPTSTTATLTVRFITG